VLPNRFPFHDSVLRIRPAVQAAGVVRMKGGRQKAPPR